MRGGTSGGRGTRVWVGSEGTASYVAHVSRCLHVGGKAVMGAVTQTLLGTQDYRGGWTLPPSLSRNDKEQTALHAAPHTAKMRPGAVARIFEC